jgi:hypothetical protein
MQNVSLVRRPKNAHAALSGWLLVVTPSSGVLSFYIAGYHTALNAIALLAVPLAVFCWIFTTIRALHSVDVSFWSVPSTYVNLITGIVAVALSGLMLLISSEASRHGNEVRGATLHIAAAIVYGGGVSWSYFYNWRKTGSASLALSLTVLQTISTLLIIVIVNLWLDRRNAEQYERDRIPG